MEKETKVYIIALDNKRYNSKKFDSYEAARKYLRRLVTRLTGKYNDAYSLLGFTIKTK
jgi:HEPN domain-containing protein